MLEMVKKALIDEKPANVDDCIRWAKRLFDEYFDTDIRQLLHNFPPDQVHYIYINKTVCVLFYFQT